MVNKGAVIIYQMGGGATKCCGLLTGGIMKFPHLQIGGGHKIMNAQNALKYTI